MAQISINHLTFAYEGSYDNVFEDVSFTLDTGWRLGLTGRNGRGKTTLLRLLLGELTAGSSSIHMPLTPVYFPFTVSDTGQLTLFVMQEIAEDTPEWQLRREWNLLQMDEDALYRPYGTLSSGEQTKAQLAALFAREDTYPLIDEPTNHLDLKGREAVGNYLRSKEGFLLVSHDRAFLNRCVDHVLSINRNDIRVTKGDYDTFADNMERQNEHERTENNRLQKDIRRLQDSARRTAEWSQRIEKGKYHIANDAASDKGYIGARSADMMKRSLHTLQRQEKTMEEKGKLLKNVETVGELKLRPLRHPKQTLISVKDGVVMYDEKVVCSGIHFTLRQGARAALSGANGAGKSSILKSVCGLSDALQGDVTIASGLKISYVPQSTEGLAGSFDDFLSEYKLDETLFKAILRNMDFGREQFDKELAALSQGQKKKMLLAKSLCESAHLYVWDEPLNYIDILSRGQLEELILTFQPTLLIVEHDAAFLQAVCTKIITL